MEIPSFWRLVVSTGVLGKPPAWRQRVKAWWRPPVDRPRP
jgi:hypothetical protein